MPLLMKYSTLILINLSVNNPEISYIDLYWLGYERDRGRFAAAQGREHRHSFGTRLFGSAKNWDWNLEAVFQIGHIGSQTISAWTVASDTGFTFTALPWSPRPGLKADIASGDKNPSDGRLTKSDKSGH